jgi:hypothetical protein
LREEHRLRVFENRVLSKIFGPKRKTDHRENYIMINFITCIFLPNIIRVTESRRMRWAGHVVRMGEGRGVNRVLVGRPKCKIPLGRPRSR